MRHWLSIYLKGVCMGAADMVPGVSGGTIALITGIYERLVSAITTLDPRLLVYAMRPHDPAARERLREGFERMDIGFLLTLGAGVGTAILAMSRVVTSLVEYSPAATGAFFFGLIGASAIVLSDQLTLPPRRLAPIMGVGIGIAASVTLATGGEGSHALPIVFLAGMIAISAMVLPGVSGAFFLLVLGQYYFMLDVLREFIDGIAAVPSGGDPSAILPAGIVVVTFLTGAVVGLLSVAHGVKWALSRYRAETLAFLIALMIGGLLAPVQQVAANVSVSIDAEVPLATLGTALGTLVPVALAGLLGAGAVLALDRYTDELAYAEGRTDSSADRHRLDESGAEEI